MHQTTVGSEKGVLCGEVQRNSHLLDYHGSLECHHKQLSIEIMLITLRDDRCHRNQE